MSKIKVCAYCRVSTDSRDQANSFENQKSYFEREIKKNTDYELVGIYADRGISGTKLQRPEFDKMLYDAGLDIRKVPNADNDQRKEYIEYEATRSSSREPKFNIIFTKNTSRFARNTNVGKIIDVLRRNKVYILFLDLNKSTKEEADIAMIKLFLWLDENESRDKSKKVKFGQLEGTKHGIIHTSGKLYGYRYIKDENKLEIIPEEAEVIKTIFNLYSSGLGIRQILNTLHDSGIKTRQEKDFCKSAIRRILDNEKYAGKNNSMKYDTGIVFNKNSYPKVKDEYMIEDSNKIPAIITWEQFEECRKLLKSKVNYSNQKGIYKGKSKYSGLIHCGLCGALYYANMDKGRKFYNCSNKKAHGKAYCNSPDVNEAFIDQVVIISANKWINEELEHVKMYARDVIFTIIDSKLKQLDNQDKSKTENLQTEIQTTKNELQNYYLLFAKELADKDILTNQIHDVEKKLTELNKEYNDATKTTEQLQNEIKELIEYLYSIFDEYYELQNHEEEWTFDEALSVIDKINIIPEKTFPDGWNVEVSYKIVNKIVDMVEKYKTIDFKPLSNDDIDRINQRIDTIIK